MLARCARAAGSLLDGHVEALGLHELQEADLAPALASHAAALDASKGCALTEGEVVIDPGHAALQAEGDLGGLLQIVAPHGAAEAVLGVVRARHRLVDGLVAEHRKGRPELLLLHDARVVINVRDDRGLVEVGPSLARGLHALAPRGDAAARLPRVLHEALHALELRLVVQRSPHSALLEAIANMGHGLLCSVCKCVHHLVVLRLVHEDALDGDADLARVEHGAAEDLGGGLLDVGARKNDRSVVAAELQGHLLQLRGPRGHDPLARRSRAREGHVLDVRVLDNHLAQLVSAGEDVDHARGEGLRRHRGEHDGGERRVRRRLDDDGVAGDHRGQDLVAGHVQGEVPGGDAAHDAAGEVVHLDPPLVADLHDLRLQLALGAGKVLAEAHEAGDLALGGPEGLALLLREVHGELLRPPLELLAEAQNCRGPLGEGRLAPGDEGLLRSSNRTLQVRLARIGHVVESLACGRINHWRDLAGLRKGKLPSDENGVRADRRRGYQALVEKRA
mmetsp:Transcript_78609/g.244837  ORF Transcript_78609/g.244837 Transcript_78609/m.244837 type:complete len:506 (-) Transcript_78609:89-1606(-)